MHRRVSMSDSNGVNVLQREHILFVDRHGNLRLPEELVEKAGIKKHVIVKFNDIKKVLEVIPVQEKDIEK